MTSPETAPNFEPIAFWYSKIGVQNGDMVMIVPVGQTGGQGFQGELVDIIFVNSLPYVVTIKNMASGPVVIRWEAICMITKVQSPEVDAETLARIKAEFEAQTGLSPDDVNALSSEAQVIAAAEAAATGASN